MQVLFRKWVLKDREFKTLSNESHFAYFNTIKLHMNTLPTLSVVLWRSWKTTRRLQGTVEGIEGI